MFTDLNLSSGKIKNVFYALFVLDHVRKKAFHGTNDDDANETTSTSVLFLVETA